MHKELMQQPTQVMSRRGHAYGMENSAPAGSLGMRLVAVDASRKMLEMERLFLTAGNHTAQMEALYTLRGWQSDQRLDSASQQRASALIWRFAPNGWDEV